SVWSGSQQAMSCRVWLGGSFFVPCGSRVHARQYSRRAACLRGRVCIPVSCVSQCSATELCPFEMTRISLNLPQAPDSGGLVFRPSDDDQVVFTIARPSGMPERRSS